jgi:hypothetical protein
LELLLTLDALQLAPGIVPGWQFKQLNVPTTTSIFAAFACSCVTPADEKAVEDNIVEKIAAHTPQAGPPPTTKTSQFSSFIINPKI